MAVIFRSVSLSLNFQVLRNLIFILLLFLYHSAFSQKMYVALGNGQGIKKVNVTANGCVVDTFIVCPNENYFALALYGNQLYYTTNSILNAGTIVNGQLTNCHPIDITPVSMSSMTVDNNGVIYSANSNGLYKWDPVSGNGFEFLGNMPFISAGDMIFYGGELYMASKTGIVKVNISNPSASTMHIAMNSVSVFAMAVLSVDCNQNKVYAFETVQAGDATDLIELDMVNQRIVGVSCRVPFAAADAASDVEGGTFSGITLNEIRIIPQCKLPGKGEIRVIREPGQAVYTYTLNRTVSNTTGIFSNLDPGAYRLEITTPGGCYMDTTVDVPLFNNMVPQVQEHFLSPDCADGGKVWFTINPDNGKNHIIFQNDTLSAGYQFIDLSAGAYHFSVVDEYYCELAAKDIILALQGSCDTMYFPGAFTPNNNGRNDVFRGLGNRSVKDYELAIYDRWGERIFYTRNVLAGWNGKIRDVLQSTGLYVYVASYTTGKGQRKTAKGTVLLIR